MKIDAREFSATVSGDASTFVITDAQGALEKCGFPAEETEELNGS